MIDKITKLNDETIGRHSVFESRQIAMNVAHHAQPATGAQS